MHLLLALALLAINPRHSPRYQPQKPVIRSAMFQVTFRRSDDPEIRGDLLEVWLNLGISADSPKPPDEEEAEVSLTSVLILRCSGERTGTRLAPEHRSSRDEGLTFKVTPTTPASGLVNVETGVDLGKKTYTFEYRREKGSQEYSLRDASAVTHYFDMTDKAMKRTTWTAIKSQSRSIPWGCPMGIAPIAGAD